MRQPVGCMRTNDSKNTRGGDSAKVEIIKLGQDVHAAQITVAMQLDGSGPQPAQKIPVEKYLAWVKTQISKHPGARVVSCYEAGPCGYWLHRELLKLGVESLVIAPQNWAGRRKNDKRDARGMVEALDRYVAGHTKVFGVVTVPTPEQEADRCLVRQRARLSEVIRRSSQQGCSLLLLQGRQEGGGWWKPMKWAKLEPTLDPVLTMELGQLREMILLAKRQREQLEEKIAELAAKQKVPAPRGVGALTWVTLLVEMVRWERFENRRQVASYCGLCPSEYSSGQTQRQGSIDKHGNPRLRHVLVETVWRLLRWQPHYPPMKKLIESPTGRSRRRAAVAVARRLAIDLWRLATGKATLEKLGLEPAH
jgi:transposase